MPPEKTIGGRERNQQETGVLLDIRLDGDGLGFSMRSNQDWNKLAHHPP